MRPVVTPLVDTARASSSSWDGRPPAKNTSQSPKGNLATAEYRRDSKQTEGHGMAKVDDVEVHFHCRDGAQKVTAHEGNSDKPDDALVNPVRSRT